MIIYNLKEKLLFHICVKSVVILFLPNTQLSTNCPAYGKQSTKCNKLNHFTVEFRVKNVKTPNMPKLLY